jgi:hypothetical protein
MPGIGNIAMRATSASCDRLHRLRTKRCYHQLARGAVFRQ